MTSPPSPTPAPLSFADLFRDVRRDFRRGFAAVITFEVLFKIFTTVLLLPALAVPLFHLMRHTGSTAVTNADILGFLLSPTGVVYAVLLGLEVLGLLLLEHAIVIGLVAVKQTGRWQGLRHALAVLPLRSFRVLRLAATVLGLAALTVLPFAILAALTYSLLLDEHDINYYLSVRPWQFYVAAGIGVLLTSTAALLAAYLYTRWVFALPIVLLENRSPVPALFAAAQRSKGARFRIGVVLLGWAALNVALQALILGAFKLLASLVLSGVGQRPSVVVPVVIGLLVSQGVVMAVLSILTVLVNSLLVLRMYVYRSALLGLIDPASWGETLGADPVPPKRFFLRLEVIALLLAFVAGVAYLALTLPFNLREKTEGTAHRGASRAAPENTLSAFQAAIDAGVEWAELDVQLTKDGEVIVLHDDDLMRMTGDKRKPGEITLAQLRQLRVKTGCTVWGQFASEGIPTLREVIAQARGRIKLNIELKFGGKGRVLASKVAELLREEQFEENCFVASLTYDGLLLCRKHNPRVRIAAIVTVALGDISHLDVNILSVNANLATPGFIRQAHRLDKQVHVWTVNDKREIRRFIERGADNIITDDPRLFVEVRQEREELSDVQRMLLACRYLLD